MRRLPRLYRILLFTLAPLWLAAFAVHAVLATRGQLAILGLSVAAPERPDEYPAVSGFLPGVDDEGSPLRQGDRLVRIGRSDLAGVGPIGFVARALEEYGAAPGVRVTYVRDGAPHDAPLPLLPFPPFPRLWLAVAAAWGLLSVAVLLRGPTSRSARAYFLATLSFGMWFLFWPGGPVPLVYVILALQFAAYLVAFPLCLRFFLNFPDEAPPIPDRRLAWIWLFALAAPMQMSVVCGVPFSQRIGFIGVLVFQTAGIAALLSIGARNYRRAGPVGRRQVRWILYGIALSSLVMLAAMGLVVIAPRPWPPIEIVTASWTATVFVPACVAIGVVRHNIFDIDRLISATASYSILAVAAIASLLIFIPRAADAMSAVAGVEASSARWVLSLLVALVVVPAHRQLRPQIDRAFFRDRYAVDRGMEQLMHALSDCGDARALIEQTGTALERLLRPETCAIYTQVENRFAGAFAAGRAVPPSFDAASPLVATLQHRHEPLAFGDARRWQSEPPLTPFDRAALETLGAAVVIPVRRADVLLAFLCLGPKRSGDVYTSTDLTLLAALGEKLSAELRRFADAEIIRQGRAMQDALRRYVPGAIAPQLESGTRLDSDAREVSILFVDIRGYSAYAETRRAEEIFRTVNRYTEAVSDIIRRHGGSVVEFNGDGMMSVFGAPQEIAHKERAAVAAGREISAAIASLSIPTAGDSDTALSVGVGIATGEVFVGNVQAVDRMIWTAIGHTVNLAARLQALTRDLDAAMLVDAATWQRLGVAGADFLKREALPIRGQSQRQDVYALPLAAPRPSPLTAAIS